MFYYFYFLKEVFQKERDDYFFKSLFYLIITLSDFIEHFL